MEKEFLFSPLLLFSNIQKMIIPLIKFDGPTPKKKYKTYNPIVIAVPKAQKELMKSIPRVCLERCRAKISDATDWFNLSIRVRVAYEISLVVYTEETQAAIKEVFDNLMVVKDLRTSDKIWNYIDTDLSAIEEGLDAMDAIEEQTTRRVQLDAWYAARKYMKEYVGIK